MKVSLLFYSLIFAISSTARAEVKPIHIEDVINLVGIQSETIKSSDKLMQSLDAEIRARDLILTPTFSSELAMYNDHRESVSSVTSVSNRKNSGLLDVSLVAPFATGTKFTLNATHDLLRSDSFVGERNVAGWEARLAQSLWRDSFGRETRLRRTAEQAELLSRRYGLLFDRQQFLINVENSFWDYVLAAKEVEVRNENIDQSSALEKWVHRRIGKFAAENSDLLQVQALLAQRELDLVAARNRLAAASQALRGYAADIDPLSWKIGRETFESERSPLSLLAVRSENSSSPVRLDFLASKYRSRQLRSEAERVSDTLKPQLDAYLSYGANGVEDNISPAWDEAARAEHNAGRIGLLFSVDLDQSLKNQKRTSARLTAEAEALRASALSRQSQIGWSETLRNIDNLRQQSKGAREVANLQQRKVNSERKRYQQGRTTVLQITTYEVDESEGLLRYYRVLADLRKAESSARIFAAEESDQK